MLAQHTRAFRKEYCAIVLLTVLVTLSAGTTAASELLVQNCTLNKAFSISVPSNPSTGYSWDASFNSSFLRLKRKRFRRDRSKPERMVGVGGTTTFVFVPIKEGETTLTLRYGRTWENQGVEKRTYRIVISGKSSR